MPSRIEVLPIGLAVKIGDDIPGVITAVFIREPGVQYEVTWWDGRTRCAECMPRGEIRVADDDRAERILVGFHA